MQTTDESKPIANQTIVFREEFDDWAILFDPDTGDAFGLNPVSVFIWKCLDGRTTIADIVGKLGKECEDMPNDAMEYVKKFVDELLGKGYAGYEL
jgi:SynChlorMet cassette protein ScmD